MKVKLLVILVLFSGCNAEQLIAKAEKKDKSYVVTRSKEITEEHSKKNWPSSNENLKGKPIYKEKSLGEALNQQFQLHTRYCGFEPEEDAKGKDYLPKDIKQFTGSKSLDVPVEKADYFAGALLFYIFNESEIGLSLDNFRFSDIYVLDKSYVNSFVIKPSDFSDYYVMTKTCGGYLNSKVDGKVNPPFVAVQAAIKSDIEQNSTILAMSGKFYSPLTELMEGNDYQSINSLMKLWKLYLRNKDYRDKSYFLKEFSGVMSKRVGSSNATNSLSSSVGLNYSGFMSSSVTASLSAGIKNEAVFAGRDWETVVFADYPSHHARKNSYASLPKVDDILRTLNSIIPTYKQGPIEFFTKDDEHKHFIKIYGIPSDLCEGFWKLEMANNNVYRDTPKIKGSYFIDADGRFGCEFEIRGIPVDAIISGSSVNVEYKIKSIEAIETKFIEFPIKNNIGTNLTPNLYTQNGNIKHSELKHEGNDKYRIVWSAFIEVSDTADLVDYNKEFTISKKSSIYQNNDFPIIINSVEPIKDKKQIKVTFTSDNLYKNNQVDGSSPSVAAISFDVAIPKRSRGTITKPVNFSISIPLIQE